MSELRSILDPEVGNNHPNSQKHSSTLRTLRLSHRCNQSPQKPSGNVFSPFKPDVRPITSAIRLATVDSRVTSNPLPLSSNRRRRTVEQVVSRDGLAADWCRYCCKRCLSAVLSPHVFHLPTFGLSQTPVHASMIHPIPPYRHTLTQTPRPSKSNKTATPAPPFLTLVALALCPCATTSLSSFQSLRSSPSLISRGSWTDISAGCSTGNRKPKYVFRLIPLEATPFSSSRTAKS